MCCLGDVMRRNPFLGLGHGALGYILLFFFLFHNQIDDERGVLEFVSSLLFFSFCRLASGIYQIKLTSPSGDPIYLAVNYFDSS